jgi:hypothetical protein
MVFVSGMIGWDGDGVFHTDDFAGQVRRRCSTSSPCWPKPGQTGAHRAHDLVRGGQERIRGAYKDIGRAYREIIGAHYPAMTAVQVAALVEDRAKVEIEVTAMVPRHAVNLPRRCYAFPSVRTRWGCDSCIAGSSMSLKEAFATINDTTALTKI